MKVVLRKFATPHTGERQVVEASAVMFSATGGYWVLPKPAGAMQEVSEDRNEELLEYCRSIGPMRCYKIYPIP
jgi:hypothetical protein